MEPINQPSFLPDYARINILSEDHITFWTKHLKVTEQQLRNAIFICGPVVKDVKQYLERNGHINPPFDRIL